ncbi:hypothetical protein V494_07068 [Pseudogymnoascus sp. VKM F-4513 (FW-928)]|nr:hypothetical protein V494_07068 [Pseudogymnoascus sp. VKM F-4513 (FW-928)]
MAPLESILSLFKRQVPPEPAALEFSILSKLPPELFAYIAAFLPAASAASFAICCKPLCNLLAIPYFKCKRGHYPFKTSELLSLLERDLKNYIACYHCAKLHTIKCDKKYTLRASRCDIRVCGLTDDYINWNFSYVVFQMAMKRHRQGADSRSLRKLLHYDSINETRDVRVTSSTRIINHALIIRHKYIFAVHGGNEDLFSNNWGAVICPHVNTVRGRVISLENSKVEYRMFHSSNGKEIESGPGVAKCDCCDHGGEDDGGTTCSGLIQCDFCATEFRIDSMVIGRRKEGRAFVITRWKVLGEGKSAEDPIWSAHITRGQVVLTDFAAGSICASFEGEGEVELRSLLTRKEYEQLLRLKC